MRKHRILQRLASSTVGLYILVGIIPFLIRLVAHVGAILFIEGHQYPERLPIDFSWYELNNTIWIQLPLFITALIGVIWLSKGSIWRQVVLITAFIGISIIPLLLVFFQSLPDRGIPKYNLSKCGEFPLYIQRAGLEGEPSLYTIQRGKLKNIGWGQCINQGSCDVVVFSEIVEQKGFSQQEFKRRCVKAHHNVSINPRP